MSTTVAKDEMRLLRGQCSAELIDQARVHTGPILLIHRSSFLRGRATLRAAPRSADWPTGRGVEGSHATTRHTLQ